MSDETNPKTDSLTSAVSARKRVPRASSRLGVKINGKQYYASEWNHIGCKLEGYTGTLEKGSRLLIELLFHGLTSESRVKCEGEVIWSRNDEIGLKFEPLPLYEENLVTHQLREALKLVGRKTDDFSQNIKPSDEIELENIKTVKRAENFAVNLTGLLVRVADYKGPILITGIVIGLLAAAYYSSFDQVSGRGTVVSDVEVVPATENGTLVKLFVSEGSSVKQGTPLFVTRDEDYYKQELSRLSQIKRDLDEAAKTYQINPTLSNPGTASYMSLLAQLKVQQNIFNMYQNLYRTGAVTRESVLEKEKELARLRGEVRIAQSKEQLINPHRELYRTARSRFLNNSPDSKSQQISTAVQNGPNIYKKYYSPANGIIVKLPRLNGSSLLKGSTLAVIQPTNSFPMVRVFLPHDASDRLQIGNKASVHIAGIDKQFKAFVAGIDKRGGLKMKVTDNQVDDLFDHNSSLQETPAEVLLQIIPQDSHPFPVLSLGAKATVNIAANSNRNLFERLKTIVPVWQ